MIDLIPSIVSELKSLGVPVYNEYKVADEIPFPCITYITSENSALIDGDTLRYSNVSFVIKAWSVDVVEYMTLAKKIDRIMLTLGATREFATEMPNCFLMRFGGVAKN